MPQQQRLQQDPNALETLLRGQTQIPRYTEEEEQLQSMIPEEQLYQAQEAQADRGMARGGPYSVSSRDSLRDSGMAELRKVFGIQRAEGEAKAYPARVTGEYNLQREGIRAQGNVETARAREGNISGRQSQQQQFQQGQQQRQQDFQAGQGDLNRAAVERNTQSNIAGRQGVADTASTRAAATQQAITNRKTGGENKYWGPDSIMKYLWGDDSLIPGSQEAAGTDAPAFDPAADAAKIQQRYPGIPIQTLIQQGKLQFDSPEEEAAVIAASGGR